MNENLETEKTFLKINKASSADNMPADDASFDNAQSGIGGYDLNGEIGQNMENMTGDDYGNTEMDNGGQIGSDSQQIPVGDSMNDGMNDMNGQMDMENNPSMEGPTDGEHGLGDDTMSIIRQLSDNDREAVRAYAESMLSRDETYQENGNEQMMESFIFKKRQLKKLNEIFGVNDSDNDNRVKFDKKNKTNRLSKKSPFVPKQFK